VPQYDLLWARDYGICVPLAPVLQPPTASKLTPGRDRESGATSSPMVKGAGSNPTCYPSNTDLFKPCSRRCERKHHEFNAQEVRLARYGHTNDKETDH